MSLFIAIEGPDGSGKSTQISLLRQALEARGHKVFITREPGGTRISEQIRNVIHDVDNKTMLPITEALLYSAARGQHVAEIIRPALERGEMVISDRFAASTMAYQGYGHGLDLEMLTRITALVTLGLSPDLIIFLDLDVSAGLARKQQDFRQGKGEWNRMDQQTIDFHRAVRRGYIEMAASDPARWLVIDASRSIKDVHCEIVRRLVTILDA